jgi:hypothetical protein
MQHGADGRFQTYGLCLSVGDKAIGTSNGRNVKNLDPRRQLL